MVSIVNLHPYAMGFIPEGKAQAMEDAGVASALGLLFSALAAVRRCRFNTSG